MEKPAIEIQSNSTGTPGAATGLPFEIADGKNTPIFKPISDQLIPQSESIESRVESHLTLDELAASEFGNGEDYWSLLRSFIADLNLLLVGTELEANPLSFGILFMLECDEEKLFHEQNLKRAPDVMAIPYELQSRSYALPKKISYADFRVRNPAEIRQKVENELFIEELRNSLGGRVNGGAYECMLVLKISLIEHPPEHLEVPYKLVADSLVSTSDERSAIPRNSNEVDEHGREPSANFAYSFLTQKVNGAVLAAWIRPYGSMRIYRDGQFRLQMMRSRTGQGFVFRRLSPYTSTGRSQVPDHGEMCLTRLLAERLHGGPNFEDSFARHVMRLVTLAILLSESKHGGSIFFVMDRSLAEEFIAYPDSVRSNEELRIGWPISGNIIKADITDISQTQLRNYLFEDGGLVLEVMRDSSERAKRITTLGSGVYFSGRGGRKDIAKNVVQIHRGKVIALVISQDGPIFLNELSNIHGRVGVTTSEVRHR
ncbi:MAG: hypothetical protein EOP06_09495 [Proteobacteria bacterium]|nr:MAG: hypothetical protein EOP06_09495 [Pseudomonadota bacterium]